jgi:transcriptional regulator with XRE-family HTH domain
MITGEQIRRARFLVKLTQKQLARAAHVRFEAVERAESSIGEVPLTIANAAAIQTALEAAGVEFSGDSVRLKPSR